MTKLVCFDLNGTLISDNTWHELNAALGVTPEEDRELMEGYRKGKFSYREGQKKLELLYKKYGKATKETIISALSRYTYCKGARGVVSSIQANGYRTTLLSNSIDLLVTKIARQLNIPVFAANNTFVFDRNNQLKEIEVHDVESHFKWNQLQIWCDELSLHPAECIYIGDGLDDKEVFLNTKHGITFEGSPLVSIAWKVITNLSDLRRIL